MLPAARQQINKPPERTGRRAVAVARESVLKPLERNPMLTRPLLSRQRALANRFDVGAVLQRQ